MAASSTGSANYPAILRAIPNDPALSSEFSDLLFLLARAGPVSSAALTFADEDVVSIVAAHGVQRATHRREDSLCDLALASGKTVVIADALSDPRVMDRRRVELESGVRFFAAVPLMDSLGRPVATLFAADTEPLTPAPPFLEALERTAGRISSRLQQRAEETRARRLLAERDPAVQEDTTDNRKAETALQASEAHYRRIRMQAIGRLAGGISHEFNNVLTTILGHSELALPEIPPGSPVRERIEVIRESALRAAALTQHLLAFSGKQVLSPRAVDLGTMLAKLRPRLASSAGPGITVDLVPPGREVWAKADPLQLEMTLLSLVAASRERMPGGGRFVIEVAPDAGGGLVPSGNWARIVVRDSGPVPSPDRIARLFEPFSDPSSLFTSTGLAFAVTYGFLTQSGGHALAAPSPDGGLEIRMVLPGSAAPNPAGRPSSSFGNLSGSGTVLVVEDEAPVRRLVRQILTAQGYEALEAASAEEALEVLANPGHSIALVLSDILMSGISGRELARRVKLERPGLPVLLMSGFDAHEGALEPGSASDVTVLPKPFRPRDLARAVKDAMGSKPAAPAESARD